MLITEARRTGGKYASITRCFLFRFSTCFSLLRERTLRAMEILVYWHIFRKKHGRILQIMTVDILYPEWFKYYPVFSIVRLLFTAVLKLQDNRDLQIRLRLRVRVRVFQCVPGAHARLREAVTSTRCVVKISSPSWHQLRDFQQISSPDYEFTTAAKAS